MWAQLLQLAQQANSDAEQANLIASDALKAVLMLLLAFSNIACYRWWVLRCV